MGRANINTIYTDDDLKDILTAVNTEATARGIYGTREVIHEVAGRHGIEIFKPVVFDKEASDACVKGPDACQQNDCSVCRGAPF